MKIASWPWRNVPPATIAREIVGHCKRHRSILYVFLHGGTVRLRDQCELEHVKDWLFTVAPRTTEAEALWLLMEGAAMDASERRRVA